jgi:hypothetical protein
MKSRRRIACLRVENWRDSDLQWEELQQRFMNGEMGFEGQFVSNNSSNRISALGHSRRLTVRRLLPIYPPTPDMTVHRAN